MMASENIQGYLEKYTATDLTNDPVPIKVYKGSINETELFGQSMQWAMEYLNMRECPPKLLEAVLTSVRTELNPIEDSAIANNNGSSLLREKLGFSLNGNPNEPLKLMQSVIQITDSVLMGLKESRVNEAEKPGDDSVLAKEMNGLSFKDEVDSPQSASVVHNVSYFSMKNQRRTNEDRIVVYPSLNSVFGIKEPASYFGVFDGHNGAEAAVYGAAQLHHAFMQNMSKTSDPKEAIVESFLNIDTMFCEKAKNEQIRSGSTVVTAVINGSKLYVAWLGDSQAVLFHDNKINDIVTPHKPEREDERQRIETEGGEVILMNEVYRVNGNLAVSRSLGDADFKNYISGKPDVIEIDLEQIIPEYLVLASDGLWDVSSGEDVRTTVDRMILNDEIQDSARQLALEAKSKDSGDNVSIIVVSLQKLKSLKSICQARVGSETARIAISEAVGETQAVINSSKDDTPVEILDPSKPDQISSGPASPAPKLIPAKACKSFPNAVTGGRIDISTKKPAMTANQRPAAASMKSNLGTNKSPTAAKNSGVTKSPLVSKSSALARTSPGVKPGASSIVTKATDDKSPLRKASATDVKSPLRKTSATDTKSPLGRTTTTDVKSPLGRTVAATSATRKIPAPTTKRAEALPQIKSLKPSSNGPPAGESKPGVKSKVVPSGTKATVTSSAARPIPRKEGNPAVIPAPRSTAGSSSRPEMKTAIGKSTLSRPATAATSKPQTAVPASRAGVSSLAAAKKIASEKPSTVTTTSGAARKAPILKAGITVASKTTSIVADTKPKSAIVPGPKGTTSRSVPLSKDKPTTSLGSKPKVATLAASRSKTHTGVTNATTRVNVKKPLNNGNQNLLDLANANTGKLPGPENDASVDLLLNEQNVNGEILPVPEIDATMKVETKRLPGPENDASIDLLLDKLNLNDDILPVPEIDATKAIPLDEKIVKAESLPGPDSDASTDLLLNLNEQNFNGEILPVQEIYTTMASPLVEKKVETEILPGPKDNATSIDLLLSEQNVSGEIIDTTTKASPLVEKKLKAESAPGPEIHASIDLLLGEQNVSGEIIDTTTTASPLDEKKVEVASLPDPENDTSTDLLLNLNEQNFNGEILPASEIDATMASPFVEKEEEVESLLGPENDASIDLQLEERNVIGEMFDPTKASPLVDKKEEVESLLGPENDASIDLLLNEQNVSAVSGETIDVNKASPLVEKKLEAESLLGPENDASVDLLRNEQNFNGEILPVPEIDATKAMVEKNEAESLPGPDENTV